MSETFDAYVCFENLAQKRQLWEYLKSLNGTNRVRITSARKGKRSGQQNRYYWGVIIKAFADYLYEDGTADSKLEAAEIAHEYLKRRFNSMAVSMINKETGEEKIERLVKSTTKLSTKEFCDYVDRCRNWLKETLGITTMDPGQYVPEDDKELGIMVE